MEKIKINLSLILPGIPHERDACVERLLQLLKKHKGINEAHVVPQISSTPPQLCFHYEPDVISLSEIEKIAKEAGVKVTKQYGHLLLETKAFRDTIEARAFENELKQINGFDEVSVSATGAIRLEFDKTRTTQDAVIEQIKKIGLAIKLVEGDSHTKARKVEHTHEHNHDHEHDTEDSGWKKYLPVGISFILLISGICLDQFINQTFFKEWVRVIWYIAAYIPVGLPVAIKGIRLTVKGDVFTEYILMTLATVGAFYITEFPEGVAVMLFYTVGEIFQDIAVNRAKRSIKALLDIRPDKAYVKRDGKIVETDPQTVQLNEIIQVKAGEKVPLDGELLNDISSFNTAALTGESQPASISKGESVLAGMINLERVIEIKVSRLFNESSLARILFMVQEATTRKSRTEQFIRRFSRIYTPIVVVLAIGIAVVPYFFVETYVFNSWLYRALIFLVISCPCALVISIPLGYFGGIGAASRNGILFKGSNFLDLMTKVNTVVMDKTGTLTKGVFKVQNTVSYDSVNEQWLPMAAALESNSTHPIAKAIADHAGHAIDNLTVTDLEEISGHGLKGMINDQEILAGNIRLMEKAGIQLDERVRAETDTIVIVAINKKLVGYITISDEIKEDSRQAVDALHRAHIKTVMLSGDKQAVVDKVARVLTIDKAYGGLLPENKVEKLEELKKNPKNVIAFVGDGINDAPVLAISDVGIAMGGLGSDAAIETADVIIQTDQPFKIFQAIKIGKATNKIVWQNISLAFGVKLIVLALGAGGIATMWEAVFADVGVAFLAILNAVRIQKMKFNHETTL